MLQGLAGAIGAEGLSGLGGIVWRLPGEMGRLLQTGGVGGSGGGSGSVAAGSLAGDIGNEAAKVTAQVGAAVGGEWINKLISNWDKPAVFWGLVREGATSAATTLALAAIAIFVTWTLAGWVRRLVESGLDRARVDKTLVRFLSNMARYVVLVLGVLACLGTFGIQVASFIAILSAAGLAVGLALQGSLSHVASGVMLLIFRPFKVGDVVSAGGQMGVVDEIDLFTTTMDTADRRRIIIPNGAIYGSIITNFSHHPVRVASARTVLAGGTSAEAARSVLLEAASRVITSAHGAVAEPAPAAALVEITAAGQVWSVGVSCKGERFDAVVEQLALELASATASAKLGPAPPVTLVRNV